MVSYLRTPKAQPETSNQKTKKADKLDHIKIKKKKDTVKRIKGQATEWACNEGLSHKIYTSCAPKARGQRR